MIKEALDKIDLKSNDADYIDIRIEETIETMILFKNGQQVDCQEIPCTGAYIRVFHQGKWFESSTSEINQIEFELNKLLISAQNSIEKSTKSFKPREPQSFNYSKYQDVNCMELSIQEKLHFCKEFLSVPKQYAEISEWSLAYNDCYKKKWFKAKDGVEFFSDYNQAGIRLNYSLKGEDSLFDDASNIWFMSAKNKVQEVREKFNSDIIESLRFLNAPPVSAGKYTVLLSPEVTGVFTHESFGHKSEADFMLGSDTMLKEWSIGKKVAADIVSIVDEGETVHSSGYCPIDDEGNIKKKTYLIKDGKLSGRLHSMSTAHALNEEGTGNGRALNFEFPPIVRMTNTYIESGSQSVDKIIQTVEKGIFIKDYKHGSGLSTFTIAPRKSYWIENGKITTPVKVAVISGSVFETLENIQAVANDFYVKSSAFGGCGKFEQWPLPVASGGPSILVNQMQVS